jgi:hypothetical protein
MLPLPSDRICTDFRGVSRADTVVPGWRVGPRGEEE